MPYFQAFQPVSVTVTFFMKSITFVMNHRFSYFDISICHSSNRTLTYPHFAFIGYNHGFRLGGACYIHLTMGTNAVFSGFSAFSVTATNFMNSITFVMNHLISYFDISICHCSNRTLCYHLFKFHGFNHGCFLEVTPIRFVTQKTVP